MYDGAWEPDTLNEPIREVVHDVEVFGGGDRPYTPSRRVSLSQQHTIQRQLHVHSRFLTSSNIAPASSLGLYAHGLRIPCNAQQKQ
jgi:hypothetical protein